MKAKELGTLLLARKETITTAESCTGGMIAAAITDIPGSSAWFETGFVTYSNEAKQRLLGVDSGMLETYGAVSEPVVQAMAVGAKRESGADWAVAVSGVAGPDGGTAAKPVGTVWFGFCGPGEIAWTKCCQFAGNRAEVRHQTVEIALEVLINACRNRMCS